MTDLGYFHSRIERDIEHYKAQSAKNRVNGKLGGRPANQVKSRLKTQVVIDGLAKHNPSESQNNPNQEPRTNNHIKNITPLQMLMAMDVSENLAKDWLSVRKLKKQAPTQTAFNRIQKHAIDNGYTFEKAIQIAIEKGWAGFNVSWLANEKSNVVEVPDWKRGML